MAWTQQALGQHYNINLKGLRGGHVRHISQGFHKNIRGKTTCNPQTCKDFTSCIRVFCLETPDGSLGDPTEKKLVRVTVGSAPHRFNRRQESWAESRVAVGTAT